MSSSSISSFDKRAEDFTAGVNTFFEALAKRWRALLALGIVLVIVAAVIAFMASRNEQKSDAGRNALYLAQKSLDTQLTVIAKAEPAPVVTDAQGANKDKKAPAPTADTVMFKKFDVDTQLADSVAKLKAISADYAGTRPGFEATLMLGQLYLNHGEPAKAADWFQKAAQGAATPLDRALSWESLGYAHENQGKSQDALDAFEKALGVGESSLQGDLMMAKARSLESLNKNSEAKATYDQIQHQLPNTEYAKLAELYQARLK